MRKLTIKASWLVPADPEEALEVFKEYAGLKSRLAQTQAAVFFHDTGPEKQRRKWKSEENRLAAIERARALTAKRKGQVA